ncbi:DUF4279 domain-containing protein [Nocardioides ultimimeridianus]
MADLARAVASLRITSVDLVPSTISALLGCEPTTSFAKGETLVSRFATRTATFGMWRLQARETEPADLDAQVAEILDRLTPDASVWAELGSAHDVDLFCGWFMDRTNEGVSISPDTMLMLGRRGIRLDIDLYGGDSDEEE